MIIMCNNKAKPKLMSLLLDHHQNIPCPSCSCWWVLCPNYWSLIEHWMTWTGTLPGCLVHREQDWCYLCTETWVSLLISDACTETSLLIFWTKEQLSTNVQWVMINWSSYTIITSNSWVETKSYNNISGYVVDIDDLIHLYKAISLGSDTLYLIAIIHMHCANSPAGSIKRKALICSLLFLILLQSL